MANFYYWNPLFFLVILNFRMAARIEEDQTHCITDKHLPLQPKFVPSYDKELDFPGFDIKDSLFGSSLCLDKDLISGQEPEGTAGHAKSGPSIVTHTQKTFSASLKSCHPGEIDECSLLGSRIMYDESAEASGIIASGKFDNLGFVISSNLIIISDELLEESKRSEFLAGLIARTGRVEIPSFTEFQNVHYIKKNFPISHTGIVIISSPDGQLFAKSVDCPSLRLVILKNDQLMRFPRLWNGIKVNFQDTIRLVVFPNTMPWNIVDYIIENISAEYLVRQIIAADKQSNYISYLLGVSFTPVPDILSKRNN